MAAGAALGSGKCAPCRRELGLHGSDPIDQRRGIGGITRIGALAPAGDPCTGCRLIAIDELAQLRREAVMFGDHVR
jgi:hypothetical protein